MQLQHIYNVYIYTCTYIHTYEGIHTYTHVGYVSVHVAFFQYELNQLKVRSVSLFWCLTLKRNGGLTDAIVQSNAKWVINLSLLQAEPTSKALSFWNLDFSFLWTKIQNPSIIQTRALSKRHKGLSTHSEPHTFYNQYFRGSTKTCLHALQNLLTHCPPCLSSVCRSGSSF